MGKDFSKYPPIRIAAYSDFYRLPSPKVWGDYWFKKNLLAEFEKLGYPVDDKKPRILLHLFGEPLKKIGMETYNILWIHSHPDWITPGILAKYRKIFCISENFTKKIIDMGFDAEPLMIPTNMTPKNAEKILDIVFVGNTRQNRARKIILDMGNVPYKIKIWGWGWEGLIPDEWYGGEYYEYCRLNDLYASARIVLNDHHEDMRREGFINPRILDVLASGGFVVSDKVHGMEEALGNSMAVYDTPEELRDILATYIDSAPKRYSRSIKGREFALKHTYHNACAKIMEHIEKISGKLFL